MITAGMIRKIDPLGRVVLPIELRRLLDIEEKEILEICEGKDTIIIKKFIQTCAFCGDKQDLESFKSKHICKLCHTDIRQS